MNSKVSDFSNFIGVDDEVIVPSTGIARPSTQKSFREIFCVNEIADTEFPKICFATDPLLLIPGKKVVGKGLNSEMQQCIITIQKKKNIFLYQTGNRFEDENIRELDEACMLIFLRDAEEAYIILEDDDGLGKKLFRFEDDVEICVYLETDLLNGKNGFYACLVRDMSFGLNVWSVTADARSAEIYLRFFLIMSGIRR